MDVRNIALRLATSNVEAAKKKLKSKKPSKKTTSVPKKKKTPKVSLREEDTLDAYLTEYACRLNFSISTTFEGQVSKNDLLKKLSDEIISSIQTGISITAKELKVDIITASISPMNVECSINSI